MTGEVQVAIASGSEDLIPSLLEKMRGIAPHLPLYVFSEFRVEGATWIPYHPGRTAAQNLALARDALRGKRVRFAGLILQPRMPYWRMRWVGLRLGGWNTIFFNENLDHFMLRPRSGGTMARHFLWRAKNFVRWEMRPGGATYTFLWRLVHPWAFERPLRVLVARLAGWLARTEPTRPVARPLVRLAPADSLPDGISVVVPSRNGRELLARLLPGLIRELAEFASEVIVIDNGSSDGTAEWLRGGGVPLARVEASPEPLSFARAVNRGIAASRFSRVMLLNNDMIVAPGFFRPLVNAFERIPDLFCATAQIFFPPGARREETGKAVLPPRRNVEEFPVTCVEPLEGEDLTYVLYGSGGCSMFDAAKLGALGGLREIYEPAYVEDLDLGWRGWQQGWPTVFVAPARVEHSHRATTSRYYSERQLARILEVNWLKFAAGTRLWPRAIRRLDHRAARMDPDRAALAALRAAWRAPLWARGARAASEDRILAIGSGELAVFPGKRPQAKPVVFIVSPYLPYPLSHGGAVRMYNLIRRAASDFDHVLLAFADELRPVPRELLEVCVEVVTIQRQGRHDRPLTERPDVVEEHDSPVFHAVLGEMMRKWRPAIAQLEFTQMAVYARDCAAAGTVLVEHDVTLDLYAQLRVQRDSWELREQHRRWVQFERAAWQGVDAVVAMSEKDRAAIGSQKAVCLANGVDLERFQPAAQEPEPGRILFIGSFAHLPNVMAVDFFLRQAWLQVRAQLDATLHVIAGAGYRFYLDRYSDRVQPPLVQPNVEVEDFVADPRPAYRRAAVVIAPLVISAGTNIKIMEAMAMGRAIVSTPAGINGLDELRDGHDVLVASTGDEFAARVVELVRDRERRATIERHARNTVEQNYSWDAIARRQKQVYTSL